MKNEFILDGARKGFQKEEYNGLFDPSLAGFFASARKRRLLVMQKLILPNGQINEKMCKRKVNDQGLTFRLNRKEEHSRKTKSIPVNIKAFKADIQPMSANEFRGMLSKRREILEKL